MRWTSDQRVADPVTSLISGRDARDVRIHNCETGAPPPCAGWHHYQLALISVGLSPGKIGVAPFEVWRATTHKLDQVVEALPEDVTRGGEKAGDQSHHYTSLDRTNPLRLQIRTADGEQGWSQLVEGGCVERVAHRRSETQRLDQRRTQSETIGREPIVVRVVVYAAARRVGHPLGDRAQKLGVVGEIVSGRVERICLLRLTSDGSCFIRAVFVFLLVTATDGKGCGPRQEHAQTSLRVSAIPPRARCGVLRHRCAKWNGNVFSEIANIVASGKQPGLNALEQVARRIESDR